MAFEETLVWLRQAERRDQMRAAAMERLARASVLHAPAPRRPGLRRRIGLILVRVGAWVAADEHGQTASPARQAN